MQDPLFPAHPTRTHDVDDGQFPGIPGYRFERRLGSGGMATVYLAIQESLDRPVAIKVTERHALQDETSKQRFENEARTIAKLSHTGIVGIHEVGRTNDGRMYYIMPHLANGDLSQRDLRDDETQIKDVLRVLLQALGYAHVQGIVHRDVKEENVLFDAQDRPHLTDFGIATSKRDTSRLTSAGLSVGSSGYMAPEQARGEEVDGRADLYSVGVLAYSLLTGDLPFRSPDALGLALMHANDAIPRLPADKRHWQSFIDRAMAKSPAQRFGSAEQMLQALEKIQRGDDRVSPFLAFRTWGEALRQRSGKRDLALLALAIGLLIATGWYATREPATETTVADASTAPTTPPTEQPAEAPAKTPPAKAPAATRPAPAKPASEPEQAPDEPASEPEQEPAPPDDKPGQGSKKPARGKPSEVRQLPQKLKNWASRTFRRR
ncbi:serine/threonine-protein kinase [Arenimonas oryziterrae]|uniref:Protein kinase domain-containing protein n=1 Tax=Arenimonas oryziterrae DSM 21050 = YC6267 TaxID=1121015 RepID=A0A091AXM6_9GAMM|nr:serine/threonine-protein kinase [Arenimonas oryziterrae]KFN45073.1 hypothetical protein N789_03360 [Arenimonas oryziterrae DSM 21050 = YC6267]